MKILVVASQESLENLNQPQNHTIIPLPIIKFKPIESDFKFNNDFDWILFTSRQGVDFFFKSNINFNLKNMKIATIGSKTEKQLQKHGFSATFIPTLFSSQQFCKEFFDTCQIEKGILYPTSSLADNTIEKNMKAHSIKFKRINVYTTQCTKHTINQDFQGIVFASPSAVDCFLKNTDYSLLTHAKIVSIGTKTRSHLKNLGIKSDIPKQFTLNDALNLFCKL